MTKKQLKKICDNIEDVIFNNVDLSDGGDTLVETLMEVSYELYKRHCKKVKEVE